MPLNITTSSKDRELIEKIVNRADNLFSSHGNSIKKINIWLSIEAVHCNGCILNLRGLLGADEFNFLHDVCGIIQNVNQTTGKLENCFVPRYAK